MLGNIFNVFSRRKKSGNSLRTPLTSEFRNRVVMLARDILGPELPYFLKGLHQRLSYLHGKPKLSSAKSLDYSPQDDVLNFLFTCEDSHFLDAIEYFFQIENRRFFRQHEDAVIDQINEFLMVDNLPYYITKSVWENHQSSFHGSPATAYRLREHPKVICRESDVLHETAMEPALSLLRKPDLLNANSEFMEGLEDYRKARYRDCVTKCNSALESTMKVICSRKGYQYSENDTANRLIKIILVNTSLDSFWEQPLQLVATIRNKLSSSHGAGLQDKDVPPHIARFTINVTAAVILLLHDEAY